MTSPGSPARRQITLESHRRHCVYLGAAPTEIPGAAGTSVPSPRSSWAVCAPHTRSSPRITSRRPRWPAGDTGRSSAASGSTPRFPCWTRTPPRCLRDKTPSLLLETSRLNFFFFSTSRWSPPLSPLTPRAFPGRNYNLSTNTYWCAHYFSIAARLSPVTSKSPLRFSPRLHGQSPALRRGNTGQHEASFFPFSTLLTFPTQLWVEKKK